MQQATKPRAVIFDMDGVLIDSYEAHWVSWVETCADRGIDLTRDMYDKLFGRSFQAFADALSPRPLPASEVADWYDEKEQRYRDIIERSFPSMPGANALVRELHHNGWRLGIASSGPRDNVNCLLGNFPEAAAFTHTISADETTETKPHPEPFLACAEGLEVHPGSCVIIEDSLHGLTAGRAGGMCTIGLTGTCTREAMLDHADLIVDSLEELTVANVAALLSSAMMNDSSHA